MSRSAISSADEFKKNYNWNALVDEMVVKPVSVVYVYAVFWFTLLILLFGRC